MKILRLMFLTAAGAFTSAVHAGYDTNIFFVTVRGSAPTPAEIQVSSNSVECQPAQADSAGHWGPAIEGMQVSIRLSGGTFRSGEPIVATLIWRNVGTNELMRPSPPENNSGVMFVIIDESGKSVPELTDFTARRWAGANIHYVRWIPGTQYKVNVNLAEKYDLRKPGTYSISVRQPIPNPIGGNPKHVESGIATVRVTTP